MIRTPTKQEVSAVVAAAKKIVADGLLFDVWSAAGDDRDVAQAAAWQAVRAGKSPVTKHWLAIAALADGTGPVPFADLKVLLDSLPETLVEPGGAKKGWGFFLLVGLTAPGDPGVPHQLARLAVRSACYDRDAFGAADPESYPSKIALALHYARAVVGLPVADPARVLETLTRAVVTRELPPSVLAPADGGGLTEVELWSGEEAWRPRDMFALAKNFADESTWQQALKDAMLAELAFLDVNRYQAKGIAFLDRCAAALPLFEPRDLVRVLAKGLPGGMGDAEWHSIAAPAIGALSNDQKRAAHAAFEGDGTDGYHASDIKQLLST